MIPRRRIDIRWRDLFAGLAGCFWPGTGAAARAKLETSWDEDRTTLATLSVRSGFDALLTTLNFPKGSEVLVSAITILDMVKILDAHGLVAVPVDLNIDTLEVDPAALECARTSKTKMILVAHLFGTKMNMQPLIEFAAKHDLPLVEDCAQVYRAKEYRGHPQSDVSLFSFGPIKTATALGGGLLSFRDKQLCDRVRAVTEAWPTQSRWQFAKRVCKYMVLITLGTRFMYTIFAWCARMLGKDHDKIIYASLRGFSGDFMTKIRHQPSIGLLRLLYRRTNDAGATASIISRRIEVAKEAIRCLTGIERPGSETGSHSHWIFPVLCAAPEILDPLRNEMVAAGFDATRSATSLRVVEPPADRPEVEPSRSREMLTRVLYIPIFEGVSPAEVQKMAAIVQRHNIRTSRMNTDRANTNGFATHSPSEKQTNLPSLTS